MAGVPRERIDSSLEKAPSDRLLYDKVTLAAYIVTCYLPCGLVLEITNVFPHLLKFAGHRGVWLGFQGIF